MHPYDAFAAAYGKAGFHGFSRKIGKRLAHRWRKLLPVDALIADLGAGDGGAVEAFTSQGFRVVGLDRSFGMVMRNPGLCVQGDMRQLPFRPGFDGVVSLYDAVNHVPPPDLPAFFAEVAGILQPGGLFAFDANTYDGTRMWTGQTFVVEEPEVFLEVSSQYDRATRKLVNTVHGWVREGNQHVPIDDCIEEWYHPRNHLTRVAGRAGFALVAEDPLFMDENVPGKPSKWLFEMERVGEA